MKIFGISGTNGAGKDSVGHMLADRHGFLFITVTDMFREEARRTGREPTRETLADVSAQWRRERGLAAVMEIALERFGHELEKYKGLVISSLRHPAEADYIREHGGKVVWIDADPKIRYQRVTANAHARGRAAEDDKTYEEFLADQEREMKPSGDAATLNMSAVKERADIFLTNNGNDIEAFKDEAEKVLGFSA